MRSRRAERRRRAACAAMALVLGGCDALARRHLAELPLAPGATDSVVLLRVTDPPGGPARAASLAEVEFAPYGEPARRYAPPQLGTDLAGAPSHAAGNDGWVNLAMGPGRYVFRLRPAGARGPEGDARFAFSVPQTPATIYIGSFRRDCGPSRSEGCRILPDAVDETDAAVGMLARTNPAAGTPRRALAQPYPPRLAPLGLAAPATAELRANPEGWRRALNWNALTETERRRAPDGQGEPRSEAWPEQAGELRSVNLDFSGSGGIAAIVILPAAVVVALPIALVVHGIITDVRRRRAEDALRDATEQAAALERARERWGACLSGMATTLDPDEIERHLRASPLHAARGTPWRAEVARLVLRPCAPEGENRYGLEVMTRWTALRAGEAPPIYDAAYTRGVAGAILDARLRHAQRAPWDLPTATEAACRPLAEWCGQDGSARLLEEVLRGVAEARDAIAAGR